MILFKIAEICSQLPFSKIYLATPDFWMLVLYYIVIAGIVYLFHTKKIKFLRFILSNGITQFCKKYRKKLIIAGISTILLFNIIQCVPRDLKIYFVDVGQRRLLCDKKSDGKKYNY